ncbi:MAG: PDZ domain-containing protein [Thiobacillus sp.]|nr:PDZ domain-containing protein [Thiobacillus sp.]MDP2977959.1 PDZ domain-containing protein [Thiobacillus sp.]
MSFALFRFLTHSRVRATIGFCLLALFGLPAMAQAPCSELGIHTINWKSPDSNHTGVLIAQVREGCVAAGLGIQPGELITGFNGKPVASQYDLERLGGEFPAGKAFSITLQDGSGKPRTLKRDALPIQSGAELPAVVTGTVPGDWLSWFKWAGFFLLVTLFMTPVMWLILRDHKTEIAIGGAAAGVYGEFQKGGREYVGAGINGALTGLLGVLVFGLIGPVGMMYNIYQPLAAAKSEADQKVCCVEVEGKYAVSQDGRWLAMVKPTPEHYFGLGDKIARTPYVAALVDLKSGRFVAWHNSTDKRWLGIEPSANSSLREVYFDSRSQRSYASWANGFSTRIEPEDQSILPDQHNTAPTPEVRYRMTSDADGKFAFSESGTGKTFALDPGQAHDKWWLSADGRVLALATRPYQPDEQYDGWFKRAYYAVRNFILDDWTVTFWDVGYQRKLATYKGYGYDTARWEDGRFLDASLDGRRWLMVRGNGFALAFDLTGKIGPAHVAGQQAGPLYHAQTDHSAIPFHNEAGTSTAILELLASLVGRYPTEILEAHPEIDTALRAALGQSYQPLMDMLTVGTPAEATADGGLTYTACKAHACPDGRLVVHISPNLKASALLFHDDQEIGLPEAHRQGEVDPDEWSRLAFYAQPAYPPIMPRALFDAARNDPRALGTPSFDENHAVVSSRFWIVGRLP